MKIHREDEALTLGLTGMAIFIWSMLRVWQGLDFTDMGFWLTGFQQFSSYPQGISDFFVNWLTMFIGHWVGVILGGGVLSYKLGYVLVVTVTGMLSFRLVSDVFGSSRMLAAFVLLTAMYIGKAVGNWVGYNNLSILFYMAGASLLYWGLVRGKLILILISGALLGANIFIRFPNLLGILLISAIWLQAYADRWTMRVVLYWSFSFLVGFTLGVLIIYWMIVLHGHQSLYAGAIGSIFNKFGNSSSYYSSGNLMSVFLYEHMLAFAFAIVNLVVGVMSAKLIYKKNVFVVIAAAGFLTYLQYLVLNYPNNIGYWDAGKWIVTGLCYILLLGIVVLEVRQNQRLALISFIAGLILLLVPLGSANGIANSKYGLWLALPIVLMWLWQFAGIKYGKFSIGAKPVRIFVVILVLTISFQSVMFAWRYTYRDSFQRFRMTWSVEHPLLVGVFTTHERAQVVSELLGAIGNYVKPGDDLLAYNGISIVHMLTESHPWLSTPWPMLTSPETISQWLVEKEGSHAKLPFIVRATGNTMSSNWPIGNPPLDNWNRSNESRRIFSEFEKRHNYKLVWTNKYFEILRPDT